MWWERQARTTLEPATSFFLFFFVFFCFLLFLVRQRCRFALGASCAPKVCVLVHQLQAKGLLRSLVRPGLAVVGEAPRLEP